MFPRLYLNWDWFIENSMHIQTSTTHTCSMISVIFDRWVQYKSGITWLIISFHLDRRTDSHITGCSPRCKISHVSRWCHDMEMLLQCWPFAREIQQSLVDSPHKGPVMQSFGDFSLVSHNKLLEGSVQLSVIWGAMTFMWCHCNSTSHGPIHHSNAISVVTQGSFWVWAWQMRKGVT